MQLGLVNRKYFNFLLSVIIHFIILIIFSFVDYFNINDNISNSNYLSLNIENLTQTGLSNDHPNTRESKVDESISEKIQSDNLQSVNSYLITDSLIQIVDSTQLDSVYFDDSRGLVIEYPIGWTFIDQKVNSKFDGVTFWPGGDESDNIPYVHLEVAEKDLFNEKNYEYNLKQSEVIWYFNSPEMIDDYITLEIYIKTQQEVDYKIKLNVKGYKNFESFRPKFLAMLKSLRFKKTYFEIF